MLPYKDLFNNYVTLSCLYAKFRWLNINLVPQPLSANVLRPPTDAEGTRVAEGTPTNLAALQELLNDKEKK